MNTLPQIRDRAPRLEIERIKLAAWELIDALAAVGAGRFASAGSQPPPSIIPSDAEVATDAQAVAHMIGRNVATVRCLTIAVGAAGWGAGTALAVPHSPIVPRVCACAGAATFVVSGSSIASYGRPFESLVQADSWQRSFIDRGSPFSRCRSSSPGGLW